MPVRFEWAYRNRGLALAPPYIFLLVCNTSATEEYLLTWPLGLTLFNLGVAMRMWAQIHLHYRLPVHKVLTRNGPYQYMRNPIYLGNTMMMLGITFTSRLLWFLPVMLLWCIVLYSLVVRREEAHLLLKYGRPYERYLQEVPRWIPRRSSDEPTAIDWEPYFWPSICAEIHCWLWLIPMVGKELFYFELT